MKSSTEKPGSSDPQNEVKAGVLILNNVSVKENGRRLSAVYGDKRISLIAPFAKLVKDELLSASPLSSMKMKAAMRDIRNGVALKESLLTQIYDSFGGDLRNILAVAKADKRYDEAWKCLITSLEVSTMELIHQLGREPRVEYGYGWYYSILPEILFYPVTITDIWEFYSPENRNRSKHASFSLNATIRQTLTDLFFGKDFRRPHISQHLPKEQHLKIENFEQGIPTELLVLEGVALNGSMLSDNGSISAAAVKKVKKQTNINSFAEIPGQWILDRVEMLCLTYFTFLAKKPTQTGIDIRQLANFAIDEMPKMIVGPMFNTFIPDMQGFTRNWTIMSYVPSVVRTVHGLLMEAKKGWMSLDNFSTQLLCSDFEGPGNYIYLNLFKKSEREKAKLIRRPDKEPAGDPKQPIMPINWFEEVGLKFAVHWVKYLCALGVVEIAMADDPKEIQNDPMEGMRYVRLTALGRYAFHIDSDYTPKAAEKNSDVEFDAKNCIITVDAKSPFQMFLANVAKKISQTRFSISANTLIAGCKNKAELEQRINKLNTIIDPNKQPAMQKIIEEAMKHTDCAVREGGYSLIRLRSDLPGLRDAILTNKELRELTILAGPTLALVKTHKMERFFELCAAYGYLME